MKISEENMTKIQKLCYDYNKELQALRAKYMKLFKKITTNQTERN